MPKSYDVFFSYSHLDELIAEEIYERLSSYGIECFMAKKDIRTGSEWQPDIKESLISSEKVILLITPRSADCKWIFLENWSSMDPRKGNSAFNSIR